MFLIDVKLGATLIDCYGPRAAPLLGLRRFPS